MVVRPKNTNKRNRTVSKYMLNSEYRKKLQIQTVVLYLKKEFQSLLFQRRKKAHILLLFMDFKLLENIANIQFSTLYFLPQNRMTKQ